MRLVTWCHSQQCWSASSCTDWVTSVPALQLLKCCRAGWAVCVRCGVGLRERQARQLAQAEKRPRQRERVVRGQAGRQRRSPVPACLGPARASLRRPSPRWGRGGRRAARGAVRRGACQPASQPKSVHVSQPAPLGLSRGRGAKLRDVALPTDARAPQGRGRACRPPCFLLDPFDLIQIRL